MVAAGFTGGEAEELRRAMGFKRSVERMDVDRGAAARRDDARAASTAQAQEQIVKSITSFALYGFPESHAASFALIAYASAYLKAHHPAAFFVALLNAWPMGFYHPATLVKDAQRHGVDGAGRSTSRAPAGSAAGRRAPSASACGSSRGCARRRDARSSASRRAAPFRDVDDLARRCGCARTSS